MNGNMYDPTSPIRDRRMTDRQLNKSERPDGLVARKERTEAVDERDRDKFDKVFVRKDEKHKKKGAAELEAAAKAKKRSPFKAKTSQSQRYTPSTHEQMLRQQLADGEQEEMVYVGGQTDQPSSLPITAMNATAEVASVTQSSSGGSTTNINEMKELVEALLKELRIANSKGITDTQMTLKHPPVLQGASVTLKAFVNAPKEFNINFTGLTQEGKALIDNNQQSLLQGLEKHGFVVHIVVSSTADEPVTEMQPHKGEAEKGREESPFDEEPDQKEKKQK